MKINVHTSIQVGGMIICIYYMIFSYHSTPEFVVISKELCRSNAIFVDGIFNSLEYLVKTSNF